MEKNQKIIQLSKDLLSLRAEASKERQLSKDHYKAFQDKQKQILNVAHEMALNV